MTAEGKRRQRRRGQQRRWRLRQCSSARHTRQHTHHTRTQVTNSLLSAQHPHTALMLLPEGHTKGKAHSSASPSTPQRPLRVDFWHQSPPQCPSDRLYSRPGVLEATTAQAKASGCWQVQMSAYKACLVSFLLSG